jgi:hypothetical protein
VFLTPLATSHDPLRELRHKLSSVFTPLALDPRFAADVAAGLFGGPARPGATTNFAAADISHRR